MLQLFEPHTYIVTEAFGTLEKHLLILVLLLILPAEQKGRITCEIAAAEDEHM